jgi:hypothetical protein
MELSAGRLPFAFKSLQGIGARALITDTVSFGERMGDACPVAGGNGLADTVQECIA